MNNRLTKSKVWQIIGIAVLCAVCVLTTVLGVVFGMNHSSEDLNVSKDMSNQDNIVVSATEENGIMLTSGVATTAADGSTTRTLTAKLTPENAVGLLLDWSVSFANPESDWAKGKSVSDYVTVTPASDGANVAQVTCKQPFAEYVKVRATLRSDSEVYAECSVDYVKKLQKIDVMFDRSALSIFGSDKTDREYVLGTSSYFVYKMDSDTSTSGATGTISVDGTFSIGSYQYNRDSGSPQTDIPRCSLLKIEHSQDYIDALKSTGAFKDTLTVQSISFSDGSGKNSKIYAGANLPLTMLNSSSLYNAGTTLTSRRNACVSALRTIGNKPFMYITIKVYRSDELKQAGFDDEEYRIPICADLTSLKTFASGVSLSDLSLLF